MKKPATYGFIAILIASTALSGCGDDGGGNGNTPDGGHLDATIDAITQGNWVRPDTQTTWQWQLSGTINTGYDVDLYDVDLFETSEAVIQQLQTAGRIVICYFSGGSSEDWRPDFNRFLPADMGRQLDQWPGENWLDIRSPNVFAIMLDRLDLAVQKGCDGVEPDNMDGFTNNTGFNLNADDQLAYNRMMANAAHERDLAVALKNDGDQAQDLVAYFDFSLNEQCHEFTECDQLQPFLDAGKPVFNAEYTEADTESAALDLAQTLCPIAQQANIRTLILPWDLDDSFRVSCD